MSSEINIVRAVKDCPILTIYIIVQIVILVVDFVERNYIKAFVHFWLGFIFYLSYKNKLCTGNDVNLGINSFLVICAFVFFQFFLINWAFSINNMNTKSISVKEKTEKDYLKEIEKREEEYMKKQLGYDKKTKELKSKLSPSYINADVTRYKDEIRLMGSGDQYNLRRGQTIYLDSGEKRVIVGFKEGFLFGANDSQQHTIIQVDKPVENESMGFTTNNKKINKNELEYLFDKNNTLLTNIGLRITELEEKKEEFKKNIELLKSEKAKLPAKEEETVSEGFQNDEPSHERYDRDITNQQDALKLANTMLQRLYELKDDIISENMMINEALKNNNYADDSDQPKGEAKTDINNSSSLSGASNFLYVSPAKKVEPKVIDTAVQAVVSPEKLEEEIKKEEEEERHKATYGYMMGEIGKFLDSKMKEGPSGFREVSEQREGFETQERNEISNIAMERELQRIYRDPGIVTIGMFAGSIPKKNIDTDGFSLDEIEMIYKLTPNYIPLSNSGKVSFMNEFDKDKDEKLNKLEFTNFLKKTFELGGVLKDIPPAPTAATTPVSATPAVAATVESNILKKLGCYNDRAQRALPKFFGSGFTVESCKNKALENNYKYFGLQYPQGGTSQCFAGNSLEDAQKYGKTECGETGGSWKNYLYEIISGNSSVSATPVSATPVSATPIAAAEVASSVCNRKVTATRKDSGGGWGMPLKFNCGSTTVEIGNSNTNSKTSSNFYNLTKTDCPSRIDKTNWLGGYQYSDLFDITVSDCISSTLSRATPVTRSAETPIMHSDEASRANGSEIPCGADYGTAYDMRYKMFANIGPSDGDYSHTICPENTPKCDLSAAGRGEKYGKEILTSWGRCKKLS